MEQLHKRFTDNQIKDLIRRYIAQEIQRKYVQLILGISKSHFFQLVSRYRGDPEKFSIQYTREAPTRGIDPEIEDNILKNWLSIKNLSKTKIFLFGPTTTATSESV